MADRKQRPQTAPLTGRHIVLGVCGSIAAYKAPELVRLLRAQGADVQCILTGNGARFVTPTTLQTLSCNKVHEGMFDPVDWDIEHISLSQKADIVVIAPATADIIARCAAGRAQDLLSSVILATTAPVLVCPAMNENMWKHPATRENVARLRHFGYHFVEPGTGELACGIVGAGRLAPLDEIVRNIVTLV
jgi:phosphopantothenoylcysteine synthetase/decarboxylase